MENDTVRVNLGCLTLDSVTTINHRRVLEIDFEKAKAEALELLTDSDEKPNILLVGRLVLEVEHNGLSNSDCMECGGGGLKALVWLERPITMGERLARKEVKTKDKEKSERRARRDYERLKKRFEE